MTKHKGLSVEDLIQMYQSSDEYKQVEEQFVKKKPKKKLFSSLPTWNDGSLYSTSVSVEPLSRNNPSDESSGAMIKGNVQDIKKIDDEANLPVKNYTLFK
jgi:hypothetical protein